jgi:hypothetical protein
MQFIFSHWHCVLPIVGIAVAMIFMRDKSKKEDKPDGARQKRISANADENNFY